MLKKIALAVVVLIIIGVCTAYYMWTKPAPKAEDIKGITITAVQLNKEFTDDEKKANASYLDKVIEISGVVMETTTNQDGGVALILDSGDPMAGVQCTMRDKGATAAKGQTVTVKGFCRGNNMGVMLNDCIIK